jgi:hypothetical protein
VSTDNDAWDAQFEADAKSGALDVAFGRDGAQHLESVWVERGSFTRYGITYCGVFQHSENPEIWAVDEPEWEEFEFEGDSPREALAHFHGGEPSDYTAE